ncbi:hypothetical protein OUZ56_006077 [Daphnia magna]|uniref:Uncharacterized protein n=1 Tax=Daphnia magna TaxID=35525 RepID=A0ABQ9YUM1_9CRUS|nr:hypothetical protein OUZ56_006077 [Daphnia magna]
MSSFGNQITFRGCGASQETGMGGRYDGGRSPKEGSVMGGSDGRRRGAKEKTREPSLGDWQNDKKPKGERKPRSPDGRPISHLCGEVGHIRRFWGKKKQNEELPGRP